MPSLRDLVLKTTALIQAIPSPVHICRWGLGKDHGTIPLSCVSGKRERDHPKRRTHHVPAHDHEWPRSPPFTGHLQEAERRPATVAKYLREIQTFAGSLRPGQLVTKETVLAWKEALAQRCAPSTVNGKLAALNTFFSFLGWGECRVKPLRRQRELFRDPGRELDKGDYLHLLDAARKTGNWRLYYLMETLASTGVRVSELQYVTVQALHTGRAWVEGKGKGRLVLLTAKLCRTLGKYCRKRGIVSGPVFVTRSGRPLDRSNIWREMRALCAQAGVEAKLIVDLQGPELRVGTLKEPVSLAEGAEVLLGAGGIPVPAAALAPPGRGMRSLWMTAPCF